MTSDANAQTTTPDASQQRVKLRDLLDKYWNEPLWKLLCALCAVVVMLCSVSFYLGGFVGREAEITITKAGLETARTDLTATKAELAATKTELETARTDLTATNAERAKATKEINEWKEIFGNDVTAEKAKEKIDNLKNLAIYLDQVFGKDVTIDKVKTRITTWNDNIEQLTAALGAAHRQIVEVTAREEEYIIHLNRPKTIPGTNSNALLYKDEKGNLRLRVGDGEDEEVIPLDKRGRLFHDGTRTCSITAIPDLKSDLVTVTHPECL